MLIKKDLHLLSKDGSRLLPCTFKASLWLCDIDNLRQIVANLEAPSDEGGDSRKKRVRRLKLLKKIQIGELRITLSEIGVFSLKWSL